MKPKNLERMRYKNDSFSAKLCYLAICFDVAYFISVYSNSSLTPSIATGIDVVCNIVFMLLVFWGSEEVKVYHRKWSPFLAVLGVLQFVRIFFLPAGYLASGQLTASKHLFLCVMLTLSGVSLLISAVNSHRNSVMLENYLKEHGGRRGDC